MLHNQQRKKADIEAREALGESFWSESFDNSLRVKLVHLIRELDDDGRRLAEESQKRILISEGLFYLVRQGSSAYFDFEQYILTAQDDMMPTVIEAWSQVANDSRMKSKTGKWDSGKSFDEVVNSWLRSYRISYELISSEMVPFSSRELHVEVVQPTLELLSGLSTWAPVELAYRGALSELSRGEAANAITDAGTALQEAFTLLGCQGNSLGPLIKSARKQGILSAHDLPMLDAIEKVAQWVSADRSENGDAHNAEPAELDDAWLILHIVGALLLRLSKGSPRS